MLLCAVSGSDPTGSGFLFVDVLELPGNTVADDHTVLEILYDRPKVRDQACFFQRSLLLLCRSGVLLRHYASLLVYVSQVRPTIKLTANKQARAMGEATQADIRP